MKAGFAATGIGLFIVALGTVVAYWDDIAEAIGFANDELEEQERIQKRLAKARDNEQRLANERMSTQIYLNESNNINLERKIRLGEIEAENEQDKNEINRLKLSLLKNEVETLQTVYDEQVKITDEVSRTYNKYEEFEKERDKRRAIGLQLQQAEANLEVAQREEIERQNEVFKEQMKLAAEEHKLQKERRKERRAFNLQIERELEDLRIEQLKEGYDKEVILINTQAKRIREDILANDKLTEEQRTELLVEQERIRQGKIIALGERRGEVEFEQMEVRGAAEIELHAKIEDKKLQITKDYDESRKQQAQHTAQAVANIAIDGLRLVSDIADLFAAKDQKAAKRAFNIKKAADIAEATMSGYKAVISTYANAPGGVVLKSIQAAIAGAFSAVQIAKIASAKFEGGQVASDLGDTSAGAGGGAMPQPSFNVVGDSGINQLAELQMQPTQAFVVSGDITTAQSLDRNKIQNATI